MTPAQARAHPKHHHHHAPRGGKTCASRGRELGCGSAKPQGLLKGRAQACSASASSISASRRVIDSLIVPSVGVPPAVSFVRHLNTSASLWRSDTLNLTTARECARAASRASHFPRFRRSPQSSRDVVEAETTARGAGARAESDGRNACSSLADCSAGVAAEPSRPRGGGLPSFSACARSPSP